MIIKQIIKILIFLNKNFKANLNKNQITQDKKELIKIVSDTNFNIKKSFKEIVHIENCFFNLFAVIHGKSN